MTETAIKPRGFAALTPEERRAIARMGGSASGSNFKNNPELAARAGKKGGKKSKRVKK